MLIEIESKKAKDRQAIGHFNAPQYKDKKEPVRPSGGLIGDKGKVMEVVAKKLGMGHETLRQGRKIREVAKTDPVVYGIYQWIYHFYNLISI